MNYPADYECEGQLSIFDYIAKPYKITKPIRLIELFAGVGSQAMALKAIGANFEHWKVVEFDKYAIASYNAIHGTNFPTIDITQIHGSDLEIIDVESFTYLLTYLLLPLHGFKQCRQNARDGRRFGNKVIAPLGCKKALG